MKHSRTERGSLGGIEGVVFGVLVFVLGTLVVANAWSTVDAKLAASAAAREAARSYVEATSRAEGVSAAHDLARQAMAGHGRMPATVEIVSVDGDGGFRRCGAIEVTVTAEVPRISVPALGRTGGMVNVESSHVEVVDPYRSGLAGEAAC